MVPVLGGVVVLAIIAAFTWAIAVYASRGGADSSERLAPTSFTIGNAESLAKTVATEGPLLFPELGTAIGTRSIVVNHTGDDPIDNWRVYWAYPADRPATCLVEQVPRSSDFIDCEGRQISVEQLAPPDAGVFPRIVP